MAPACLGFMKTRLGKEPLRGHPAVWSTRAYFPTSSTENRQPCSHVHKFKSNVPKSQPLLLHLLPFQINIFGNSQPCNAPLQSLPHYTFPFHCHFTTDKKKKKKTTPKSYYSPQKPIFLSLNVFSSYLNILEIKILNTRISQLCKWISPKI